MFLYNSFRKIQHLLCCARVKGCCMLIQKQKLGRIHGCHEKCQRLSLSAGKKSYRLSHTLLKSDIQKLQFRRAGYIRCVHADVRKPSAFPCCKCQILFYSHSRCSSPHRILIQATDGLCTYMLGHKSNVLSIQHDHTGICKKISTDRIKQSGFTSSIGTDDRCKIALLQIQG